MSEPFLGEIRMFGGNYAPVNWAFCNGQLLQIQDNQALFSIIGTFYGGNGSTTFGLPDLRGRVAMHQGPNFPIGYMPGSESVALSSSELPAHTHVAHGTTAAADRSSPEGALLAATGSDVGAAYGSPVSLVPLSATSVGPAGASKPHDNMQPFVCLSYIIALAGIYPQQS